MQEELVQQAQKYLKEILNLEVSFSDWQETGNMPIYLSQGYEFYQGRMLGREYLLACKVLSDEDTPFLLKKQLAKICEFSGYSVILLSSAVASYTRRRWIEKQIQFIIPGNQLYLPELGLDLREHFRAAPKQAKHLSPSSQSIILSVIYNHAYQKYSTKILKEKTGYALMTLNRVFDELVDHDLAKSVVTGTRERAIYFLKRGKELWEAALPHLKSPVKGIKWVRLKTQMDCAYKYSGISALAEQSLLTEPRQPIIAMTAEEFKLAVQNQLMREVTDAWESNYKVEIWSYSPAIITQETRVDPLSLYLCTLNDDDTRTRKELENVLESFSW
jgi:hypothetical protein